MYTAPKRIQLDDIAGIIANTFEGRESITCYVGSNAATPTAALQALTRALKSRSPALPFLKIESLRLVQDPDNKNRVPRFYKRKLSFLLRNHSEMNT